MGQRIMTLAISKCWLEYYQIIYIRNRKKDRCMTLDTGSNRAEYRDGFAYENKKYETIYL